MTFSRYVPDVRGGAGNPGWRADQERWNVTTDAPRVQR
jgi:hypothetical protein